MENSVGCAWTGPWGEINTLQQTDIQKILKSNPYDPRPLFL